MKDNRSFYKQLGRFVKDVSSMVRSNAPRYKTIINEKTKKVGKKGIRMVDLQIVRSRLNASYQQLGQAFYQESSPERLKPFSRSVRNLVDTIKSLQFEMERLQLELPGEGSSAPRTRKAQPKRGTSSRPRGRPKGSGSGSRSASAKPTSGRPRGRPPGSKSKKPNPSSAQSSARKTPNQPKPPK